MPVWTIYYAVARKGNPATSEEVTAIQAALPPGAPVASYAGNDVIGSSGFRSVHQVEAESQDEAVEVATRDLAASLTAFPDWIVEDIRAEEIEASD